jgi:endonuclease/exonuclease/phosphatase (EEP) superfamily protein YafD
MLKQLWIALALGTIAAGLAAPAAEIWWLFELVSHFRLQYLAGAAVLLLFAVAFRRKLIALALLTTIAINAWPVLPYLPTADPIADGERLTILNVNVRGANRDYGRIVETIRARAPDVVTVIELTPALERALAVLADDYPHRFAIAAEDNYGLGVWSRHALGAPARVELGATPAIETQVAAPFGRFRLIAVHTVPPVSSRMAAARNAQFEALAARARRDSDPLVICGDLNSTPYSPYFDRLRRASGTADARRGQGFGMSWPSFMPLAGVPIDHCLTRGPFATESVERLHDVGSDHYPMLVTLRWRSGS